MQGNSKTPAVAGSGIWAKLLQIQKSIKTFALTEDSDKKEPGGKSAYRYTPGWKITEDVRAQMDALNLMLIPDIQFHSIEMVEYPVYKMIGGNPMSFVKKEMHIAIDAKFTWRDVETGEEAGPYSIVASGANGTDKSTASALALAERYFLLKFFHISTHEADEEPDAHDSDYVPGIPKSQQQCLTASQACAAAPVQPGQGVPPMQGRYPTPAPYQPQGQSPAPYVQTPQPQSQGGAQVNIFPAPPAYGQGPVAGGSVAFNEGNPLIRDAIVRLANFDRGTVNHSALLNEIIAYLSGQGVNCTEPNFITNLAEAAQARRENRQPRYV
jgi:ERF superfamily.